MYGRRLEEQVRAWVRRRWPRVHLRTLLFIALFLVASLPGFAALFLRVYENTVVRQTEASVVAQAAAIGAAYAYAYSGAAPDARTGPSRSNPYGTSVGQILGMQSENEPGAVALDLSVAEALPERRVGAPTSADPVAVQAGSSISRIAAATSDATFASIRVLDRNGVVVAGREDVGRSYAALEEVGGALSGVSATVLRRRGDYAPRYPLEFLSRAAGVRIHHARPVIVNGRVIGAVLVSRSPRSLFRGIGDDLGRILLGIALISAALLALAALLSRGIARPIERLGAASRSVASGAVPTMPDTPATAIIEIQALFADFQMMAERIAWRNRYLRDFAAAISHEFKTPLAGIRGALELLADHGEEMSSSERRRFVANAAGDTERLSRLTGRLLEMARADLAVRETGTATALEPVLQRVADAFQSATLTVRVIVNGAVPLVCVPAEVLETVLITLVENSRQAGATKVNIDVTPIGQRVLIGVVDNGPGIPEFDRARLFEPFFTTRREQGGSGLGLSIAHALLSNSGGDIRVTDYRPGARFDLTLPAS